MRAIAVLVIALALPALFGCVAPGDEPQATVALDFSLAALSGAPAAGGASSSLSFTSQDVYQGVLLVTDAQTQESQSFTWSAYIDGSTFAASSNKTIVLFPGTYDFHLLLMQGGQHYAGTAYLQQVVDGTNSIALTLRPIIGDPTTDVQVVQELADFRFEYDAAELAGFPNPMLGILVDGGTEHTYPLNPLTGLSASLLINLLPGAHTLQLRFYSNGQQRGRSLPEQEAVTIAPGVDVTMDLVALQGEIELLLDEAAGQVTFSFAIPPEVVAEAGGLADLHALLTVTGGAAPLEALLSPAAVGDHYEATVTLGGFQYGNTLSLSLAFSDQGDTPVELLGACLVDGVVMQLGGQTVLCPVALRRRAVIGGSLLGTIAVNAYTPALEPVPGAVVSADGTMVGITGCCGFGSTGYLRVFLPAGSHALLVTGGGMKGGLTVEVAPLGLETVDIVLDTPIAPGVTVVNETDLPEEADYCVLQWPPAATAAPGADTELIFGRIFEAGLTEPAGDSGGVLAQVGMGPSGSDPRVSAAWSFFAAAFNVQFGNDDEYMGSITVPAGTLPGTIFAYTLRFSLDGGASVTYCDLDGAGSDPFLEFDPVNLGTLTVSGP